MLLSTEEEQIGQCNGPQVWVREKATPVATFRTSASAAGLGGRRWHLLHWMLGQHGLWSLIWATLANTLYLLCSSGLHCVNIEFCSLQVLSTW